MPFVDVQQSVNRVAKKFTGMTWSQCHNTRFNVEAIGRALAEDISFHGEDYFSNEVQKTGRPLVSISEITPLHHCGKFSTVHKSRRGPFLHGIDGWDCQKSTHIWNFTIRLRKRSGECDGIIFALGITYGKALEDPRARGHGG